MTSRRIFLKNGGLALVSLGFAPEFLARTAAAAEARRKVLITIFQRGAVDGLNMIVPFGERAYDKARPSIAIGQPGSGPGAVVDLDGFFGSKRPTDHISARVNRSLLGGHPAGTHLFFDDRVIICLTFQSAVGRNEVHPRISDMGNRRGVAANLYDHDRGRHR